MATSSFNSFALKGRGKKRGSSGGDHDQGEAKRKATNLLGFDNGGDDGDDAHPSTSKRPAGKAKVFVIPKQEDTFVPGQGDRRFNAERYLPESAADEVDDLVRRGATGEEGKASMANKFCKEEEAGAGGEEGEEGGSGKVYGLEVRRRREDSGGERPASSQVARSRGGRASHLSEEQAFRNDVRDLPEELGADSERYVAMPVEEFGKAMMRGMGWREGKGVGRNAKEDVKVVEFLSRPDRLGLGARPKEPTSKPNWINKPGEDKSKRSKVLLAAAGDAGRVRHTRHLDEKMVEYKGPGVQEGKRMAVVGGKHEGLQCVVLRLLPRERGRSAYASVRLVASEEVVEVRCKELAEPGRSPSKGDKDKKGKPPRRSGGRSPPWLHSGLRVRVVDKHLGTGKAYLKKAVVVDVVEPHRCDVVLDEDGKRMNGVSQSCLETVVPKAKGTKLLVVKGGSRGRVCTLVKRMTSRGKATVHFLQDLSIAELSLDDVCEYTGQEEEDLVPAAGAGA
ncbi:G-patch domain-containing protein [Chloropicon primus]|uniref:G-patch domain-containing protein n=2 Tax=Chloropicon primus TaxID=1764295 RepID=A0A5B8MPF0_9CHLO|nr:hypothetical protein A3770_07p47190 [Chloropicon primus]UPR01419.1 G-patch domain-containing protein [Chloropicon primus]|eukprot:QDZ22201.1 hypothetical protein A3770_07p47190 [Chloropicon primus]